jgi:hypothetical protein
MVFSVARETTAPGDIEQSGWVAMYAHFGVSILVLSR